MLFELGHEPIRLCLERFAVILPCLGAGAAATPSSPRFPNGK